MKTKIKLMFIAILGIAITASCKKEEQASAISLPKTEQELAIEKAKLNFTQSKWQLEKAIIREPKDDYFLQRSLDFKELFLELNNQQAVINVDGQRLEGLYEYAITYNFSQVNPITYFNYQFNIIKSSSLNSDELKYLTNVAGTVTYSSDNKYFSLTNDYFKTELLFKRIN